MGSQIMDHMRCMRVDTFLSGFCVCTCSNVKFNCIIKYAYVSHRGRSKMRLAAIVLKNWQGATKS